MGLSDQLAAAYPTLPQTGRMTCGSKISLGADWSFGVPHNKEADLGRYTWMLTSLKYYLKNLAQREFIHTTGRAIPVQHLLSQSEMAHGTQ